MAEPIRRVLTRTLTLTAVVAALSAGSVRTASAVSDFRTPGRAAYCGISHGERPYGLICWTPRDGFTVDMQERGTAGKRYEPKNVGYHDVVGRKLRFGGHWHVHGLGFWCTSRRTGLTCWNRAGRGWWLGRRRGYRLF
jgi:hypothetical protein